MSNCTPEQILDTYAKSFSLRRGVAEEAMSRTWQMIRLSVHPAIAERAIGVLSGIGRLELRNLEFRRAFAKLINHPALTDGDCGA